MPSPQRRANRARTPEQRPAVTKAVYHQMQAFSYLAESLATATVFREADSQETRKIINRRRVVLGNIAVPRDNEGSTLLDVLEAAAQIGLCLRAWGMTEAQIQEAVTASSAPSRAGLPKGPRIAPFPAAANQ